MKRRLPIRAVADHHVDRSEVEVQQCMQLTDTNRPTGLLPPTPAIGPRGSIQTIPSVPSHNSHFLMPSSSLAQGGRKADQQGRTLAARRAPRHATSCRPGGHSEGAPPDPIPNSAVKPLSAHGTASQDAGESVGARPPDRIPSTATQTQQSPSAAKRPVGFLRWKPRMGRY